MKTFKKQARDGEILLYKQSLNFLSTKYNGVFSTLILPHSLLLDESSNSITLPFYEGETFNDRWNNETGGSLLGIDLALETALLIRDLALIDIEDILPLLSHVSKIAFDHTEYLLALRSRLQKFVDINLLTQDQKHLAYDLLRKSFSSPLIFNNGDFYPRNFIRTSKGKIVLIDWEVWNAHSPFYIFDHPENVAAVCFVSMWKNELWQKRFVCELQNATQVTKSDFQKAILIKSLEMAEFWFKGDGQNSLCKDQMRLFSNALNTEYMDVLWDV